MPATGMAATRPWRTGHTSCKLPFITVGAAGGKQQAELMQIDNLSRVTHDPLLAQLRYRLRKQHGAPRDGKRMDVACVFSRKLSHARSLRDRCRQPRWQPELQRLRLGRGGDGELRYGRSRVDVEKNFHTTCQNRKNLAIISASVIDKTTEAAVVVHSVGRAADF